MAVGANTSEEEVYAAVALDLLLIAAAFLGGILGIAVEDVDILAGNVYVAEEIRPHESIVALFVVAGNTAVFIHIERNNVLERNLTLLIQLDQIAVHAQRRTARRASENERMFGSRFRFIDARRHIIGRPGRYIGIIGFDNKSHL